MYSIGTKKMKLFKSYGNLYRKLMTYFKLP